MRADCRTNPCFAGSPIIISSFSPAAITAYEARSPNLLATISALLSYGFFFITFLFWLAGNVLLVLPLIYWDTLLCCPYALRSGKSFYSESFLIYEPNSRIPKVNALKYTISLMIESEVIVINRRVYMTVNARVWQLSALSKNSTRTNTHNQKRQKPLQSSFKTKILRPRSRESEQCLP